MGRPFGIKEIQACLPNLNIRRVTSHYWETQDVSSAPNTTDDPSRLQLPTRAPVAIPHIKPLVTQTRSRSPFEVESLPSSPTPLTRTQRAIQPMGTHPSAEGLYSNLIFGSISTPMNAVQNPGEFSRSYLDATPYSTQSLPMVYTTPYHGRNKTSISVTSATRRSPEDQRQVGTTRFAIKDILQKLPASVSSRSSGAGRTVMYDPLKDTPVRTGDRNRPSDLFEDSRYHNIFRATVNDERPTKIDHHEVTLGQDANDLQQSEPDISRSSHNITGHEYHNSTSFNHDSILLKEAPTPQSLEQGSLLTSLQPPSARQVATKMQSNYDSDLRSWFTSGNKAERHEDFYQRILSYHTINEAFKPSTNPDRKNDPGVIGRPSAADAQQTGVSPSKASTQTSSFDKGVTRLLIPLMENLAGYVEGPLNRRHGHWAPFTPPPEWAIDKSLNGNSSFFDEDWGKPPERIGRDQRYRAFASYGRPGGGMRRKSSSLGGEGGATLMANNGWSPIGKTFS
ncbi:hypothetical protein K461DRAFT_276319 [Myriangium duriaei CBS 260.36]|uniref:Uncharacterized protein n=1 Tax=Myriangium duriaei CBS 260.36 TaxID=1168546 RepID=A0A9P4MHS2_9PEZI|nr:hypothetical protein K461DRAFT_276319 [Myriangium duriaei CBS 260.36]